MWFFPFQSGPFWDFFSRSASQSLFYHSQMEIYMPVSVIEFYTKHVKTLHVIHNLFRNRKLLLAFLRQFMTFSSSLFFCMFDWMFVIVNAESIIKRYLSLSHGRAVLSIKISMAKGGYGLFCAMAKWKWKLYSHICVVSKLIIEFEHRKQTHNNNQLSGK